MRWFKVLVLALGLLPATLMAAGKVAVLDVEGAIRASKQVKELQAQLAEQFAGDRQRLQSLADEGNALKEKLEKEGDFLSADERKALVVQVQQKFKAFQQLKKGLQKQTQEQERVFLNQLRPKVEEILKELVEKHDFELIFNKRALVYSKPAVDITSQVVEALNKQ